MKREVAQQRRDWFALVHEILEDFHCYPHLPLRIFYDFLCVGHVLLSAAQAFFGEHLDCVIFKKATCHGLQPLRKLSNGIQPESQHDFHLVRAQQPNAVHVEDVKKAGKFVIHCRNSVRAQRQSYQKFEAANFTALRGLFKHTECEVHIVPEERMLLKIQQLLELIRRKKEVPRHLTQPMREPPDVSRRKCFCEQEELLENLAIRRGVM
jgi:hypothetical protein